MHMEKMKDNLLKLVRENSAPALGCTEPVAVAYAGAAAKKYFKGQVDTIEILVSKNIYKNGKSVIVPGTGEAGLDLAGSLGFVGGNSDKGFMVLKDISEDHIRTAKIFLKMVKLR